MVCKWSSLNAPGIEIHLSHPILELSEFPFPIIGWDNKKWLPCMKVKKTDKFQNKRA